MNSILKSSAGLFGKTLIINILCFIVVISVVSISMILFSDVNGYVVYGSKTETDAATELYTHYLSDGEDTRLSEYEAEGYTVVKNEIKQLSPKNYRITLLVGQIFAFGILISFTYPNFWSKGFKDRNLVMTGNMEADKLKGLKIGLLSQAPMLLLLLVLAIIGKIPVAIYKIVNACVYSLIELVVGNTVSFADLSALKLSLLALMLIIIPIIVAIAYYLGYKDISIGEKFMYKKSRS